MKGIPRKGKASRSENADRRSKQRKGTNRSLPEAKGTVLESRNEKRSKSSSTLTQSLQEEKDQVQQPSKNDVPEELNDLNLTMQSHMERKAEETEIQDDDLTGNSSEKECSAPMHDRLKDTESAEKHKLLDDSEKPTLKDVTSTAEGKRKRKQKRCRKVSGEKKSEYFRLEESQIKKSDRLSRMLITYYNMKTRLTLGMNPNYHYFLRAH